MHFVRNYPNLYDIFDGIKGADSIDIWKCAILGIWLEGLNCRNHNENIYLLFIFLKNSP